MTQPHDLEAAPFGLGAALRARGFERLTPIQAAVLDPALAGRDLRLSSQTGSGKTVALGLAVADALLGEGVAPAPQGPSARPSVLVVAPTRELAAQIGRELGWLLESAGVVAVTGGTSVDEERRRLAGGPGVVAGTPGRLLDHLRRGHLSLDRLAALVLDEADEMLDMGFEEELEALVAQAPAEGRRTHLVSATFGRRVLAIADRYQRDPAMVRGTPAGEANGDIDHVATVVPPRARLDALVNVLLRNPDDKTLVFVRTRADVLEFAGELAELGFPARGLSGEMTQRERTRTLDGFRTGAVRVLVATDVASRGLDVADVTRVVQVDLPEGPQVLTHRAGRTGRAGRKGESVLFVAPFARRRADAMLRAAGIDARWAPAPSPADVRAAADARLLDAVRGADEASPDRRALASRLLDGADPEAVVAALLDRLGHTGPCAARELPAPPPLRAEPRRPEGRRVDASRFADRRGPARRREPDARGPGRAPRDRGAHGGLRERRAGEPGYVTFQVSWGARMGADPRRLLALVCRRGGVDRDAVGAIRVAPGSSTVDVAAPVADRFAQAVQRRDPRDPHVRFRPLPGAGHPSANG